MKFSPSIVITLVVMILLIAALVVLAFSLGGQFAIMNLSKSMQEQLQHAQSTSTPLEAKPPTTVPSMILPDAPRSEWAGLDMWLRGTVLHATDLTFGEKLTLALNSEETNRGAVSEKNEVYVYFTDVVFDSRCPENVDCYTAGEAIVEVQIQAFNKPTQSVYLSSLTGGKPNRWTYHGLKDDSFMTPEIKAEIARGQKIVAETTYVRGETHKSGGAIVDGYVIGVRGLTPNRVDAGDAGTSPIAKNDYIATFVVNKLPPPQIN